MSTLPYPRTRNDTYSIITIPNTVRRVAQNENREFPSESAARAFRPAWFGDPWGATPPLTEGIVAGKVMSDIVVPGAKKLIASGVVIQTNPMDMVDRAYSPNLASYKTVARWTRKSGANWAVQWVASEYFARPSFTDPPFPKHDLNRLTAARAEMRAGYMDLLTSLVEFRKTVELIVKFRERFLLKLDEMIEAWARRQRRPFATYAQAMESLSSFWLEWRFGWRILWYDYQGILATLLDISGEELRKPFRSRESSTRETEQTSGVTIFGVEGTVILSRTQVFDTQLSGGCLGTGRYHGVTFDPITTAWELLPLSLVLDMFWNIGDWLGANSPFAQVSEVDAWTSVLMSRSENLSWLHIPPTNSAYEIMKVSEKVGATSFYTRKSRKRQTHVDTPIFPEINLSPSKLVDLGAISIVLRSLVTKRIRFLTSRG